MGTGQIDANKSPMEVLASALPEETSQFTETVAQLTQELDPKREFLTVAIGFAELAKDESRYLTTKDDHLGS